MKIQKQKSHKKNWHQKKPWHNVNIPIYTFKTASLYSLFKYLQDLCSCNVFFYRGRNMAIFLRKAPRVVGRRPRYGVCVSHICWKQTLTCWAALMLIYHPNSFYSPFASVHHPYRRMSKLRIKNFFSHIQSHMLISLNTNEWIWLNALVIFLTLLRTSYTSIYTTVPIRYNTHQIPPPVTPITTTDLSSKSSITFKFAFRKLLGITCLSIRSLL